MGKVGTAKQIIDGFITLEDENQKQHSGERKEMESGVLGARMWRYKLLLPREDTKTAISDGKTHESKEKHTKEYKLVELDRYLEGAAENSLEKWVAKSCRHDDEKQCIK